MDDTRDMSDHVDYYIESYRTDPYVSLFLHLHRLPATMQSKFQPMMEQMKLFCTYQGKRYQVTGASRLGDVFLHDDLEIQTVGYALRVDYRDCSEWSPEAVYSTEPKEINMSLTYHPKPKEVPVAAIEPEYQIPDRSMPSVTEAERTKAFKQRVTKAHFSR